MSDDNHTVQEIDPVSDAENMLGETKVKEEPQEAAKTNKPAKMVKRKRGPKTYQVRLGDSTIQVSKGTPKSAISSAVRGYIKNLPLRQPIKVYAKSRSKLHTYEVKRDYDNIKYRRFEVKRTAPAISLKKLPESHDIPPNFLSY